MSNHLDFVITGFARSRTAWLANFFTYGGNVCLHEALGNCEDTKEVLSLVPITAHCGISDTMAFLFLDKLRMENHQLKTIIILRPLEEIKESLRNCNIIQTKALSLAYDQLLWQANKGGSLVVPYNAVDSKLELMWHYVGAQGEFPAWRAKMLSAFSVQLTEEAMEKVTGREELVKAK